MFSCSASCPCSTCAHSCCHRWAVFLSAHPRCLQTLVCFQFAAAVLEASGNISALVGGGGGKGKKSSHLGKYPGVGLLLGHRVNRFKSNIGVWGVPRRSAVNTSSSVRAALLRYPQLKENIIPESRGWDQVGMELRFLRSLLPGPLRPAGGSTPPPSWTRSCRGRGQTTEKLSLWLTWRKRTSLSPSGPVSLPSSHARCSRRGGRICSRLE